jgi:immunoglobulin-binding protein 1
VLIKAPFNSAAARLQSLERADALLSHYLTTCEKLHVLNESDTAAWQRLERGEAPFAPEQAREQKIARFKAQRASEKRLQEITSALRAAADTAAAASSSSSSSSSTTVSRQSDAAAAAHREGLSRESHILQLESYAREALDELSNLSREKAMLVQMVTAESRSDSSSGAAHDERVRQSVNSAQGQGLEVTHLSKVGGQLRMQKEVVRANVFKPTVAPPTMTLEEFADIELADAMARAEQEKLAPVADRRYEQLLAEGLEDNEELSDIAAVKDRAWDNWKEDHPKGYGNKANKRF